MQIEICEKLFGAEWALEPFDANMNVRMLLKVGLLSELLIASMKFTLIWFFICVDP
jgi:hypothetical protein